MQFRSKSLVPVFLIITFSVAIYANSLKNGFVFDDSLTIVNNDFISDVRNFHSVFNKDYFVLSGESSYRPGVTVTYFLDYAVFGLTPWGYHLTNVLLHALNGILLYIFLALLFKPDYPHPLIRSLPTSNALLCTLLFLAHPVLTEAVNAVSFREDLLVFFFYMAAFSLYLFLRSGIDAAHKLLSRPIIYVASCLLYFLALISKEMALTLPLIILCYEWLYASTRPALKSFLLNKYNIGYMAVTFIYGYLRFVHFDNPATEEFSTWSLTERIMTIPWLLLKYVVLMACPVSLSADYVVNPITSIFSPAFVMSFFSLICISAVAFLVRKKERHVTFGTFFFFATLSPVYNIIPISNPFAERYLYLPAAGFIIIAASLAGSIADISCRVRKLHLTIFTILIIVCSIGVVNRNKIWQRDELLWSDTIGKMPDSSRAHNNLGFVYFNNGRIAEAITEYKAALRLNPDFAYAHNNLGFAYYNQNKLNEAERHLLSAIKLNPAHLEAYMNLGMVYYESGRLDDSAEQFKMVLRININSHNAHNNLGVIYEKQEKINEAVVEYQTASRLKPDDSRYHFNLGKIYAKQRRLDEAVKEFNTVLKLKPNFLPARQALEALNHRTL